MTQKKPWIDNTSSKFSANIVPTTESVLKKRNIESLSPYTEFNTRNGSIKNKANTGAVARQNFSNKIVQSSTDNRFEILLPPTTLAKTHVSVLPAMIDPMSKPVIEIAPTSLKKQQNSMFQSFHNSCKY